MTRPVSIFIPCALILPLLAGCGGTMKPEPRKDPAQAASYFPGDPSVRWTAVGSSVEGRPIYQASFGSGDDVTLVFGGFHGSEPSSAAIVFRLAEHLARLPSALAAGRRAVLIPILNPDGYVRKERRNARGVDLNRNYPSENWGKRPARRDLYAGAEPASEPETQAVLRLLDEVKPRKIVSIHAPLSQNNYDGPTGERLARVLAKHNHYPVTGYIGYPTPGSFGTYAGVERKIPMVTLELPAKEAEGDLLNKLWDENRSALMAVIND